MSARRDFTNQEHVVQQRLEYVDSILEYVDSILECADSILECADSIFNSQQTRTVDFSLLCGRDGCTGTFALHWSDST